MNMHFKYRLRMVLVATQIIGLSLLTAATANAQQVSGSKKRQEKQPAKSDERVETPSEQKRGDWTCPMHPQVHHAGEGHCPICAMSLIPSKNKSNRSISNLETMLSLAVQHNPEIRAARARVIAAEAELDRTQLEVLQKIIAFRDRWRKQQAAAVAAQQEVDQALAFLEDDSNPKPDAARALVIAAQDRLAETRSRLSEIEAEIPFLIGRKHAESAPLPDESETRLITEELIPMIERVVRTTVEEYRMGEAELADVYPWTTRLTELKVQIAPTRGERIKAVESHTEWLQGMFEIAQARHRAGQASIREVLAAQIYITESKVWLQRISRGAAR